MRVVLLSAIRCGQCPAQKAQIKKLIELDSSLDVRILDADDEDGMAFAKAYGVRGVPYTAILSGDELLLSKTGLFKAEDIFAKMGAL